MDDVTAPLLVETATPHYQTYTDSGKVKPSSDEVRIPDTRHVFHRLCSRIYPTGFKHELVHVFKVMWPIVLTQLSQLMLGPVSIMFCGHLNDPIQLDGAALALSMINATCVAIGQGLGTACDTFFSQTFGSTNKKKLGVYVQRAILIFLLALMPCYAIHINLELLLTSLGQNPDVAKLTGRYLTIFIPGALSFFMYVIVSKYIQTQNIVLPNFFIGVVANGVNALLHYILVFRLGWGTDGSAISLACGHFTLFSLTVLYILISGVYEATWGGWSLECLQNWGKFLRLAIPGMLMLCMEWWGFEIGIFVTGILGTTELGAQSVLLQIDSIWFQIPLGIEIACAIRIGQYLGAGNAAGARTIVRLSITLVVLLSMGAVLIFILLPQKLPYLFTNVDSVVRLVAQLLPIVALYVFFDAIALSCKGVLFGTGRQIIGAVLIFVSYYMLALPMGIPLMFYTSLRSAAYWWALAGNLMLQSIVLSVVVGLTNWDREVAKAQERAGVIERRKLIAIVPACPGQINTPKTASLLEEACRDGNQGRESVFSLVVKRVCCLVAMATILLTAIVVRLTVPLPTRVSNSTDFLTDYQTTSNYADVVDVDETTSYYTNLADITTSSLS